MRKSTFDCPGCGKSVNQITIKNHITNCLKYKDSSIFYARAVRFNDSDKLDQLKFLYQELEAAKQHIQKILSKKISQAPVAQIQEDEFDFLVEQVSSNVGNNNKSKSQIIEQPQNPDLIKQSNSFKQGNQIHSDNKYQKPQGMKVQQEYKPNDGRGMRMQQEYNYPDERMGSKKKPGMKNQEYEDNIIDLVANNPDITTCPLCKKRFYTEYDIQKLEMMEQCWRFVCRECFRGYIERQFVAANGFPKCPFNDCTFTVPEHQSRAYLGDRFQHMQDKIFQKSYSMNLVQCNKCKAQYEFARGNPNDAPKKDQAGKIIKAQHAVLYAEQRFICPRPDCKTQQCKQCKVSPYHLGMSCKQAKDRALMLKCRYCYSPISEKNVNKHAPAALSDICNSQECQSYAKDACTKVLGCGHPCSGVKNQAKCLPCLKEGCCQKVPELGGITGDDYCNICYSQGLSASPSIKCECGHIFHFKCIKKRYQIKWLTPRILFNFCVCPLCKKWIQVPPENQLYKTIKQMKELHELIEKMSFERLKFEECEKDEKLVNKESIYYGKPRQYAMAIYAYFMCFKCKKPYFGGRKNCAEVMNADQNRQKEGFDEKQLVCPKCCDIPIQNCPKHGVDFIEFKCKFCCSTAQWFCWGNTHFCQPCHKRQCNGDYVSKYTRDQLPKCQGPGKCPIGGNHGPNGDQKMLGCAICRNYKENSKNF